jgi:hypothetical protein
MTIFKFSLALHLYFSFTDGKDGTFLWYVSSLWQFFIVDVIVPFALIFLYLKICVVGCNSHNEDLQGCLYIGNASCHLVQNLLSSSLLLKKCKD